MKTLLKNAKKNSIYGLKEKRKLKIITMGNILLLLIGVMCFMTGEASGAVIGVMSATVPILSFTMPEGVEFTENEKKAVTALAEYFNKQFQQYVNGQKTQDDLIKSVEDALEQKGFSVEKINKLTDSLKEQGTELAKLKEKAKSEGAKLYGLKKAFHDNWDGLQKALKENRQGYTVKVDEHDAAIIHTTDNIASSSGSVDLEERIQTDPNLYLKRRDRQYIHDIANVSYVDEVPEVLTFWEEGDETGAIATVSENTLKPQVKLKLVKNQAESQKAAGYIVVTDEVIKWRSRAWAAIQRLFRDKVYRDYENLLTDDMITKATSYVSTPLDGTIASPTDFDAFIAAILQGETLNYQFDTLVINPSDKWRLAMTQTNNGMFILPYIQQGGQFGLLGLRVITTNKVSAGNFLIGESGTWNIEEEAPSLRTGLVNDDLIHNRMTIVGELFFLSYVASNNAGSWIHGNFADIKEALSAPAA